MLPSRSWILTKAVNTMEMQRVANDWVVCGSSDAVIIRTVVISRHTKAKKFRPPPPHDNKALQTRKIIKFSFLSLLHCFLTESSQYQSLKENLFPALSGNDLGLSELKTGVLTITPRK